MAPKPGFRPDDVPDLTGKVALVTGPKTGIGFQTVRMLARKGCTVYLAGRGLSSLQAAISRLRETYPDVADAQLIPLELDLSSTVTAVKAARSFPGNKLDIIIANAAISLDNDPRTSPEGWERHFQTNHLGHFAFIMELLPLMEKSKEARIVVTASNAYQFVPGTLDFDALRREVEPNMLGFIGGMKRYGMSKLANILFAKELDRRLKERGVENVWVNAVHPGAILNTQLGGTGEQYNLPRVILGPLVIMAKKIGGLLSFSQEEGALGQVWAATSKTIVEDGIKGQFMVPVMGWTGGYVCTKVQVPTTEAGRDEDLAKRLWEVSQKAIEDGLKAGGVEA